MKNYEVTLWSGYGYYLNEPVIVNDALDEMDALIQATLKDFNCLMVECESLSDDEKNEYEDNYDSWIYLDRSEYDACNVYLCIENLRISEVE